MFVAFRKLFFPYRKKIYGSKSLALLYLGCHAWLPLILMVLISFSLIIFCPTLFENSGSLLVGGAVLAELLYFYMAPEWRNVVKHLGAGMVSITKDKGGEKAAFYIGEKRGEYEQRGEYEHIDALGRISKVQSQPPVVSYDLKSEINELELLKMFYTPSQFGSSPYMMQPSLPLRHIDTIVAAVIGLYALIGTIIWGFGDPSAW